MSKLRIESVKIVREVDQDPDLSYLGEYGNHDEGRAIDREERGDAGRNEFRYFNPAMTGEETGNPDSPEQDYERCEAYNRGEWCMMGVYAVAEVVVNGTVQRIRSGGLWGIESDSGAAEFRTTAHDELCALRNTLAQLGATKAQLDRAFRGIEDSEFVER